MKNIFKRRKEPLIIAPSNLNIYVLDSCMTIIPTASDTAVISDPKTVSAIERTLDNQAGIRKSIKIVNTAGNFEAMANALRNEGYTIDVKGG